MQKHNHATQANLKRELVYDRLYRNGLKLHEKRATLYQRNNQSSEDLECTFQPNLEKKLVKLKPSHVGLTSQRVNKENSKTPEKINIKDLSHSGSLSPSSRLAIKKDITNIARRGIQKSFLEEAREAAAKRSRDFNLNFGNLKRKNHQNPCITPRSRVFDKFLLQQIEEPQLKTSRSAPKQIKVNSKTPRNNPQRKEIVTQETNNNKLMKCQSTKPKIVKHTKTTGPKPIINGDELSNCIRDCIQKAMMLSQTLDREIINQRKQQHNH